MPAGKGHAFEESLAPLIFTIRGHRVVLDADLARLYGVTTKRLNEATKRNRQRFPDDFAFQLTRGELSAFRSQFATLIRQPPDSASEKSNWSQYATSPGRRRPRPDYPN